MTAAVLDTSIRAIPTWYSGCYFRSRLEARWAVLFDLLRIPWMYEPQGYYVGHPWGTGAEHNNVECMARPYLPDFFLPDTKTWVEVKGSADAIDWQLLANSVDWGYGLPGTDESAGTQRGLLLLGPIPPMTRDNRPPAHAILQHHKGGEVNLAYFDVTDQLQILPEDDCFFDSANGLEGAPEERVRQMLPGNHVIKGVNRTDAVRHAYIAARSARFEHGEYGSVLGDCSTDNPDWWKEYLGAPNDDGR